MADEPDWHTLIQATVRECVRTWELQARTGPVTSKAREAMCRAPSCFCCSASMGAAAW